MTIDTRIVDAAHDGFRSNDEYYSLYTRMIWERMFHR